jgi:hypothetical protein
MGGRIKFFVSGSAALSREVQEWFYAAGLLVLEGYGLTETSAATFVNNPRATRFGTVGPPVPGTEVRIADDGEILVKGPGVMQGYHNLDEATAEAFEDGWFHTGDIGELDDAGYLRITDRKKDLIKTSGGKYVAPQKVEGAVKAACPYVSQVIVHGEGRKYVSALFTLDPDAIGEWAAAHGKSDDLSTLARDPDVRALIEGELPARALGDDQEVRDLAEGALDRRGRGHPEPQDPPQDGGEEVRARPEQPLRRLTGPARSGSSPPPDGGARALRAPECASGGAERRRARRPAHRGRRASPRLSRPPRPLRGWCSATSVPSAG